MKWFDVLRIAAAMCFIGHGAFGVITKAGWLPYFAVVGIGPDLGYFFMPLDPRTRRRVSWTLRASIALLLAGHGLLALSNKPLLVKHLAVVGVTSADVLSGRGWFEVGQAAAIVALPVTPLLILACAWKVATELLFPLSGDYWWEFIERGGNYGVPLALALLGRYSARS